MPTIQSVSVKILDDDDEGDDKGEDKGKENAEENSNSYNEA
jgi:hypothetical protein